MTGDKPSWEELMASLRVEIDAGWVALMEDQWRAERQRCCGRSRRRRCGIASRSTSR